MELQSNRADHRGAATRLVRAWLTHRHLPLALVTLTVLLLLPALSVGWLADDHWLRVVLLRPAGFPDIGLLETDSHLDLFRFLDGDPERAGRAVDLGILPWWTYTRVRGGFWRPLASLTHWLDFQLWPNDAIPMHAQSVLWCAALVAAAAFLYRRLMGVTVVAGLAALLFAIDDAHGTPVGFLSNRNALLAAFFGVLALIAHDRWRRDGRRSGAILAPLLLALSLLSAEAGVATVAYLIAHAVFLDRGRWPRRVAVLTPYLALVVAWRLVWGWLGYGVSPGLDFYIDPAAEPLRYALAVLERAPILLLGQWGVPPSDVSVVLGATGMRVLWLVAVAFVAVCAVVIVPVLRKDAVARFWAVGMLLSLLPCCATWPMDRLLLFVGLGAFGVIARFLHAVFARPDGLTPRLLRIARVALAAFLVAVHGLIAPAALLWRAANPLGPTDLIRQAQVTTPMDASVARQTVVLVNSPSTMLAGFLQVTRALDGRPVPLHVRALSPSRTAVEIRRTDERTLVLRPDRGYLYLALDQLFRPWPHPLDLGETVELPDVTVTVTALTEDGRPAEAAFRFAVPLEDPSLRWLRWSPQDGSFVSFTPPPIAETVRLQRDRW